MRGDETIPAPGGHRRHPSRPRSATRRPPRSAYLRRDAERPQRPPRPRAQQQRQQRRRPPGAEPAAAAAAALLLLMASEARHGGTAAPKALPGAALAPLSAQAPLPRRLGVGGRPSAAAASPPARRPMAAAARAAPGSRDTWGSARRSGDAVRWVSPQRERSQPRPAGREGTEGGAGRCGVGGSSPYE